MALAGISIWLLYSQAVFEKIAFSAFFLEGRFFKDRHQLLSKALL
jgi:hypothetical protein